MALSDAERHDVLRRLAWLEAQAHRHPGDARQPTTDREVLQRLARLQAAADVRRRSGDN